jgi:predicted secreted protein
MPRLAALIAALLLAACAAPPPAAPTAPPAPSPVPAAAGAAGAEAAEPRRLPAAAPVASVDLDNAADGTRATVKRGTEVKIVLDANITTGFQWQEVPPNGEPALTPVGQRVYAPKSAGIQNVGAGGINVFRFRGEQPGKVTLRFDYRRPWENVPPAKSVRYEVTVE